MKIAEWQHGYKYHIAMDGNLLVRRERGVKLGDVRIFHYDAITARCRDNATYYAEREFRSIIPFRAPKIWWRKIDA